jgi:tetratricopeptide (TPR) repeat protein
MRFTRLFIVLFFTLAPLLVNANQPPVNPVVKTVTAVPIQNIPQSGVATQNNTLIYHQLFDMKSQLASLTEQVKQQKQTGNEVKALENELQNFKTQLAKYQTTLSAQEITQVKQLNSFDERIADIIGNTNMWFFTLTLLLAFGGFIVYRQSRKEAESVALQQMKDFIDNNKNKIIESIDKDLNTFTEQKVSEVENELKNLQNQAKQSTRALQKYISEAHSIIAVKQKEIEQAAAKANKLMADGKEIPNNLTESLEIETKNIDKKNASVKDYMSLATVSYAKKEYHTALKLLNKALRLSGNESDAQYAKIMFNKSVIYNQLKQPKHAIEIYDVLINHFKERDDSEIQESVIRAMFNKGVALGELEKKEQEIKAYDALINQFKDSEKSAIQEIVAQAMLNKGVTSGQLKKTEQAIETYDDIINQFKHSDDIAIRVMVANGMFNKGFTLDKLGRSEQAIEIYDALINQFKGSDDSAIQELVALVMFNKGVRLDHNEEFEQAIEIYDALISQFKDSDNSEVQDYVTKAMFNKGGIFVGFEKLEQAIEIYDALINLFKGTDKSVTQEVVAKSMLSKGGVLGQLKKQEQAIKIYDVLVNQFQNIDDCEIQKQVINALANAAELSLLFEAPEKVLNRIIQCEGRTKKPQILAIMKFIRFLLNDLNINDVVDSLETISNDEKLTWQFAEIKGYLDSEFSGEKHQEIQAVVSYFEQHQNLDTLKQELGFVDKKTA